MSRILRRPMFRGGPVDSRGSGITSGLDKPKRGLVNEPGGYAGEKSGMDFLKNALNKYVLGSKTQIGNTSPFSANTLPQKSSFEKMISNNQFGNQDPTKVEDVTIEDKIESYTPKNEVIREILERQSTYVDDDGVERSTTTGEKIIVPSKTTPQDGFLPTPGPEKGSVPKKTDTSGIKLPPPPTEKEESVEYTVEDYVKMLGGDKARRRDLSDMLASASASFLGTGGVKEGFAEFMSREAAKGPGRLEKIEQAAATLDIKDKIDSKRSKEKIELMKENTLFELRAKSDALKAAGDISKMNAGDALTYISKEIYRGQKDRSSSRVLKTFLDIKLNTDSNVKNVGDLTSFLNDAEEVSSLPEGITIVTSDQGKRVYLKRGDKVELVDINKL